MLGLRPELFDRVVGIARLPEGHRIRKRARPLVGFGARPLRVVQRLRLNCEGAASIVEGRVQHVDLVRDLDARQLLGAGCSASRVFLRAGDDRSQRIVFGRRGIDLGVQREQVLAPPRGCTACLLGGECELVELLGAERDLGL